MLTTDVHASGKPDCIVPRFHKLLRVNNIGGSIAMVRADL